MHRTPDPDRARPHVAAFSSERLPRSGEGTIDRSLVLSAQAEPALYRPIMVEFKVRVPEDVHRAMKLTAQRQGTTVAGVARTSIVSYVSFDLARAGDEASEAVGDLFDAARRATEAWPL